MCLLIIHVSIDNSGCVKLRHLHPGPQGIRSINHFDKTYCALNIPSFHRNGAPPVPQLSNVIITCNMVLIKLMFL